PRNEALACRNQDYRGRRIPALERFQKELRGYGVAVCSKRTAYRGTAGCFWPDRDAAANGNEACSRIRILCARIAERAHRSADALRHESDHQGRHVARNDREAVR